MGTLEQVSYYKYVQILKGKHSYKQWRDDEYWQRYGNLKERTKCKFYT